MTSTHNQKIEITPIAMQYNVSGKKINMNKNIIMRSFKSSRDIQKKEGGPDGCFG